jgi:5-methylthioadenosine/S-adenosylhomocysteine deaminase
MTGPRTVIRGGLLLDPAGRADLQDVLIEDGRILFIGNPGFEVSGDAQILSAVDRMLIPGLVNAHTHSHGALNRGAVGDRVSLEMFLTGGGASTQSRGIDDKYFSAALSAAEMIRKGCTSCFDLTVEFPGPSAEGISAVARAYRDAGMRAVIAPMISDRTIYQALPACWRRCRPNGGYNAQALAPRQASRRSPHAAISWPTGRSTAALFAPRLDRPFHCIAVMTS